MNRKYLFKDFFEEKNNRKIKYLVLHHIEDKNISLAIKELKKHKVSAHYIIDENGEIFQLVEEKNIAYHAGISYWDGKYNLNDESIGIEFLSKNPYKIGFSDKQIESGIKLCKEITNKYQIDSKNIIGHSDIAYDQETGFLNRKDDPSDLFPWEVLSKNNLGIHPILKENTKKDKVLFKVGDNDQLIKEIKSKLSKFGYKIDNINEKFDKEFANLTAVFNRRFNQNKYADYKYKWLESSSKILEVLL